MCPNLTLHATHPLRRYIYLRVCVLVQIINVWREIETIDGWMNDCNVSHTHRHKHKYQSISSTKIDSHRCALCKQQTGLINYLSFIIYSCNLNINWVIQCTAHSFIHSFPLCDHQWCIHYIKYECNQFYQTERETIAQWERQNSEPPDFWNWN